MRQAVDAINRFVKGRAIAEYEADLMLRSAVERQFGIVGEALSQLAKAAPDLAARIPELRNAVSFRNVLIHGYDRIEDRVVWRTIVTDLPALRARVEGLLIELGMKP